MPKSRSVVGKLVGAGIALIFMGFGILAYADVMNNSWNELWLSLALKPAPFNIADPTLGIWAIIIGFLLIGIAYVFNR